MPEAEHEGLPAGSDLSEDDYWRIYDVLVKMISNDGNWIWQRWHYLLLANSFLFAAAGAIMEIGRASCRERV